MPNTWRAISKEIIGYIPEQTQGNEQYVAVMKVQKLINGGNSDYQVALIWNGSLAGSEKPVIKKGINKWGIAYNTKAYAEAVTR